MTLIKIYNRIKENLFINLKNNMTNNSKISRQDFEERLKSEQEKSKNILIWESEQLARKVNKKVDLLVSKPWFTNTKASELAIEELNNEQQLTDENLNNEWTKTNNNSEQKQDDYRHNVSNNHKMVLLLEEMEQKFKDSPIDLQKLKNIVVIDDNHMQIWRFIHQINPIKVWEWYWDSSWKIWKLKDHLFWTWVNEDYNWSSIFVPNKAKKYCDNVWCSMYSSNELKELIELLPWNNNSENIIKILWLKKVWVFTRWWEILKNSAVVSTSTCEKSFWNPDMYTYLQLTDWVEPEFFENDDSYFTQLIVHK